MKWVGVSKGPRHLGSRNPVPATRNPEPATLFQSSFLQEEARVRGIRDALVVRHHVRPTLAEALSLDPQAPGPAVEYYVSDEPPYYLGHRRGQIGDDGQFVVVRESVLLDFQSLSVTPRRRLVNLLAIRRKILEDHPQVLWWKPEPTDKD